MYCATASRWRGGVTEQELIERVQNGDHTAFAELVGRHREIIWAVCYRVCGNTHDAEDALQETLVAVWRNIAKFRGDARLSTWLYRIATNASLVLVRKRRESTIESDQLERRLSPTEDSADHTINRYTVDWALTKIPRDFAETLILREFGGLSYQEIADAIGIPIDTVKSRINRARRAMAELLETEQSV